MSAVARRRRTEKFSGGAQPKNYRRRATYFSALLQFLRYFSVTCSIFLEFLILSLEKYLAFFTIFISPEFSFLNRYLVISYLVRVFRQSLYIGYLDLQYSPYNMTLQKLTEVSRS